MSQTYQKKWQSCEKSDEKSQNSVKKYTNLWKNVTKSDKLVKQSHEFEKSQKVTSCWKK